MMGEKYILDCPACGRVEGFMPTDDDDEQIGPGDEEETIEEDILETKAGPAPMVRCPRCGRWIGADRACPA